MSPLIHALVVLAASTPAMASRPIGKSLYQRTCEYLVDPGYPKASADFTARTRAIIGAREFNAENLRYIGEHAVTYPELFLDAMKAGHTSDFTAILSSPERAEAFFRANPDNALFAIDMMAVTDHQKPERYRFMIEPLEKLVLTPDAEIERRHPGFNGPKAQAEALNILKWLGHHGAALDRAAVDFLSPPRWQWPVLTLHQKISPYRDYRYHRSSIAGRMSQLALAAGRLSPDLVENLVEQACRRFHPFQTGLWEALVVDALTDAQKRRLAEFWRGDNFTKHERHWLKHSAKDLVTALELLGG